MTDPTPTVFTPSEYRRAEIDHLRAEIRFALEEAWKIEKFAIGAAAALVAWLATQQVASALAWWLPFAVVAAGGIRFAAIQIHVDERISVYLRDREKAVLGPEGGWETWFKARGPNQTIAHWLVWLLALADSAWIGFDHLQVKPQNDGARKTSAIVVPVVNISLG